MKKEHLKIMYRSEISIVRSFLYPLDICIQAEFSYQRNVSCNLMIIVKWVNEIRVLDLLLHLIRYAKQHIY